VILKEKTILSSYEELMPTYKLQNKQHLLPIKEESFKLEKDIQKLTENNLEIIFGLDFVRNEFPLMNFRIDTLAFDNESKSFVIIEYKKDRSFSVIDQGYAYLSLMLNNKADFILEYYEIKEKSLKRDDIDWSQSKVIFISPSFTSYQRESINFKDLPIELWEIKKYGNGMVNYNQIKAMNVQESVKTITRKDKSFEKVSKEIKVYTENEHKKLGSDESLELYEKLKTEILNFGDIELKPKKYYLTFIGSTNIIDIRIQRTALKFWINLKEGELDDPKQIARNVSNIGHWGNGDYEIRISDDEYFEYILSLIKQSYNINKK